MATAAHAPPPPSQRRSESPPGYPSRTGRRWMIARFESLRKFVKRRRKLRATDIVVISRAKSGRTWLATMISHVYHRRYGIPETELIQFDNFHRQDQRVPRILFSHDNRRDGAKSPLFTPEDLRGKKVVFLVRDPRDIAVSGFFHWVRKAHKHGEAPQDDQQLFDFVVNFKMPLILAFLERWRDQLRDIEQHLVIRYEDLRARPEQELERLFHFIEGSVDADEIAAAVAFGSFDVMRRREAENFFSSDKLRPSDPDDPRTFKVRKGKVGGYRDYFDEAQLARIEAMLEKADLAVFGYRPNPVGQASGA